MGLSGIWEGVNEQQRHAYILYGLADDHAYSWLLASECNSVCTRNDTEVSFGGPRGWSYPVLSVANRWQQQRCFIQCDYQNGGRRQRNSPVPADAVVSVAGGRPGIVGA